MKRTDVACNPFGADLVVRLVEPLVVGLVTPFPFSFCALLLLLVFIFGLALALSTLL